MTSDKPQRQPARRAANAQPNQAPPPPAVPPEVPKVGLKYMKDFLVSRRQAITRAIPNGSNLTADAIIQNLLLQVDMDRDKRRLLLCRIDTILNCVLIAAKLGFDLGTGDQAYLIAMAHNTAGPDGKPVFQYWQMVLWPSYKGLITVARRAGYVVDSHEVCANDQITINAGTENRIDHNIGFGNRGEMVGVYCTIKDAAAMRVLRIETMDNSDLQKISADTVCWNRFPGEMARKTCVKRGLKWLPRDDASFKLVTAVEQRIEEGSDLVGLVPQDGSETDDVGVCDDAMTT